MHISEQVVILIVQGCVTLILGLLVFSFRSQIEVLKSNIATQDAHQGVQLQALKAEFISRIDSAAMERQTTIAELKDYLSEKLDQRSASIVAGFVPIRLCELMHAQSTDKQSELLARVEHIENRIDEINAKLNTWMKT